MAHLCCNFTNSSVFWLAHGAKMCDIKIILNHIPLAHAYSKPFYVRFAVILSHSTQIGLEYFLFAQVLLNAHQAGLGRSSFSEN